MNYPVIQALLRAGQDTSSLFPLREYNQTVLSIWLTHLVAQGIDPDKASLGAEDAEFLPFSIASGGRSHTMLVANSKLALDDYLLHPVYPVTADELCAQSPLIAQHTKFVPAPFLTLGTQLGCMPPDNEHLFTLPFEVVKLMPTWDDYLVSLSAKRRYQVKKVMTETPAVFGRTICSPNMLQKGLDFISARFGPDEVDYAKAQFLLGYAMHAVYPKYVDFYLMRADTTLAMGFVQKHDFNRYAIGQSYAFSDTNNIGALFLAHLVKYMSQHRHTLKVFNPSNGVRVKEVKSDIYKRVVCNHDAGAYNLAVSDDPALYPPYYNPTTKEWVK